MSDVDVFNDEQKQYLQGFMAGAVVSRQARATFGSTLAAQGEALPAGPERVMHEAQDRVTAAGGKLVPEELAKRKKFPLDLWDEIGKHCKEERFPKGTDVLMFKFNGLFYVAPAQDSYMCRLRFAGGILSSGKLKAVADIAEALAAGHADVTTRANLQVREIPAANGLRVLEALHEAGIVNRGSGADNIRNVTGNATAGIDPDELIDVGPLCREMHHYILNHREMYCLPRKFNIAFDGGGAVSALEDTNDIGFTAVKYSGEVWFRLALAGITGHRDFAHDTGCVVKPSEAVEVAAAIVRVFIGHGDRTDRKKARLKYLIDVWGRAKFLEAVEKELGRKLVRAAAGECERPAGVEDRYGHMGVHRQKQAGLSYVGVVLPVGRLTSAQMRGLAKVSDRYGSGTIRLTVWQNLIISDIANGDVAVVVREVEQLGLGTSASSIRAGLVACTGNKGCKFAAADTKGHARAIADYVEERLELDEPVNVHVTGCHHSCAQHFIGDIGLIGTKVGEEAAEGYHVFVGGGYGERQEIGREIYRDVVAAEAPRVVERMLRGYVERRNEGESFTQFVRRHSTDELKGIFEGELVGGAS
jgi:ferredoxin-nitrite reductase